MEFGLSGCKKLFANEIITQGLKPNVTYFAHLCFGFEYRRSPIHAIMNIPAHETHLSPRWGLSLTLLFPSVYTLG